MHVPQVGIVKVFHGIHMSFYDTSSHTLKNCIVYVDPSEKLSSILQFTALLSDKRSPWPKKPDPSTMKLGKFPHPIRASSTFSMHQNHHSSEEKALLQEFSSVGFTISPCVLNSEEEVLKQLLTFLTQMPLFRCCFFKYYNPACCHSPTFWRKGSGIRRRGL